MAGMRDRLIHDYFGVDYEIVWDVVQNHMSELQRQIAAILEAQRATAPIAQEAQAVERTEGTSTFEAAVRPHLIRHASTGILSAGRTMTSTTSATRPKKPSAVLGSASVLAAACLGSKGGAGPQR